MERSKHNQIPLPSIANIPHNISVHGMDDGYFLLYFSDLEGEQNKTKTGTKKDLVCTEGPYFSVFQDMSGAP